MLNGWRNVVVANVVVKIMNKIEYNPVLSAWRKGDLVRVSDGEEFRLTSERDYCEQRKKVICDTDRGKPVSYLKLIEKGYLIETGSGRKNEPCK